VGVADWVKPSIYHDCGGARFRDQWNIFHRTVFADLDRDIAMHLMYSVLNMDATREPTLSECDRFLKTT
jgi:hypothetical protein